MGIDNTVFSLSRVNMFDQRAQQFSHKWFPNLEEEQQFMMNTVNTDFTGAGSPLDPSTLLSARPFVGFGSSAQGRLPSDSPSTSTDTSNDPNPDGPEMENGNANCYSPVSDSVYSDAAALGTPNSFVDEKCPTSPEMFFEAEHRERLYSASSSAFTYSPYSHREEEPIPLTQPCVRNLIPALNRQASFVMVEQFFGDMDSQPLLYTDKDISPLANYDDDSDIPPYPSPSFTAHFNASTEEAISSSQGEEFFDQFCDHNKPVGYQCDGSPATESNQTTNSSEPQTVQSSDGQAVVTTAAEDPTVSYLQLPQCGRGTLSRECSNLSDIISDSMPTNSLDTQQMLQDFVDTLPPSQPTYATLNSEAIIVEVNQPVSPVIIVEDTEQSPKGSSETTQQDNTNTEPKACDISVARRNRNNAACRQSRKRRKDKKIELENQVEFFSDENDELRVKIEQLEVECKRMKQSILSAMTDNRSR